MGTQSLTSENEMISCLTIPYTVLYTTETTFHGSPRKERSAENPITTGVS